MAIFTKKAPVAAGVKSPKLPKNGQIPQKGLKSRIWAISRIPDPGAGVVLHQPLAAGPCTRFRALRGRGGFWPPGRPQTRRRAPARLPGPRDGDRAPARGVDVKPPPRWRPGPRDGAPRLVRPLGRGQGAAGSHPGSGDPGTRPLRAPGGSREAPEGSPARPGRPRGGCFTSTPRGGALSPAWPASPVQGPEEPTPRGAPGRPALEGELYGGTSIVRVSQDTG